MRRIYAIIGVVLIAGSFWLGYKIGQPDAGESSLALDALNRKYDSISVEIIASKKRETWYASQSEKDLQSIDSLNQQIKLRQKNHLQTQNKYGTAIKAVENYSLDELDSFLIDLYPSPGIRKFRYNADGSIRYGNEKSPEMEVKNDGSAGDSLRFADERVQEDLDGQRRSKPYCGKAGSRIGDEGWGIGGVEGSTIVVTGAVIYPESEGRVLVSEIQGSEETEKSGNWLGFSSSGDTHLFIH